MKIQRIVIASLFVVLSASMGAADVVEETFSYVDQSDTSAPFRITTNGLAVGDIVLDWTADGIGFANGVGVVSGVAFLDAAAQTGLPAGNQFVGIADIPGFNSPKGGPFGAFFATAQDLASSTLTLDLGRTIGNNATMFRMLAEDIGGEEIATNFVGLTGSMASYLFTNSDFTNMLSAGPFDESQVTNLSIEFFVTPDGSGNTDALRFELDNFKLVTVPEPGSMLLILGLGVALLSRRRI